MQPALDQTNTVLSETESVCPVCLKVVPAEVIARDKAVYLKKVCPEHGEQIVYAWPDAEHYRWMEEFRFPLVRPSQPIIAQNGCPSDCGLCTSHLRHPTLVELELTERCNLRCPVCFMAAGAAMKQVRSDPDLAVIEKMYKAILAKTGPATSIQLTGGEPTIRKDLPDVIRLGRSIGFNAIEVNTNGVILANDPSYAASLAEAGASGVYLQFDGVTRQVYEKIRGDDILDIKLKAIEHCRSAGLQVVLAMTIIAGINDEQLGSVLDFALKQRDVIAGIAYQPAFGSGRFDVSPRERITMGDAIFLLAEQSNGLLQPYDFWPLGCSHPICDSATYLIEEQGQFTPITRLISPRQYAEHFDSTSPQGSVLGDIAVKMFPQASYGLSIIVMNFMDALSMDLKRLRECSMTVAGPDGRMIPFCAYQLTDVNGKRRARNQYLE